MSRVTARIAGALVVVVFVSNLIATCVTDRTEAFRTKEDCPAVQHGDGINPDFSALIRPFWDKEGCRGLCVREPRY